jgi:hypothetical protein
LSIVTARRSDIAITLILAGALEIGVVTSAAKQWRNAKQKQPIQSTPAIMIKRSKELPTSSWQTEERRILGIHPAGVIRNALQNPVARVLSLCRALAIASFGPRGLL